MIMYTVINGILTERHLTTCPRALLPTARPVKIYTGRKIQSRTELFKLNRTKNNPACLWRIKGRKMNIRKHFLFALTRNKNTQVERDSNKYFLRYSWSRRVSNSNSSMFILVT